MKSRYRNTILVVYLLLCLFITFASAHSFIRQFTDDLNTDLPQEDGAKANPIMGEAHYSNEHDQDISSRDYKVSSSNALTGLRALLPMSYSLKMESFNTLLQSNNTERYVSRPFPAGGYNWSLVVYPKGNKEDGGSGYLSLYVAIDNSSLLSAHREVHADLRFYIFNKKERKFFTIQETHAWRFNVFKTMWGFSQVLPVDTFRNPSNGYIYDGDHCEFGVDVTFPTFFQQSELFSVATNFPNPKYTWTIEKFSTLLGDSYSSDTFSIGGRNWNILVYPNGHGTGKGKALSMFLSLNANEKFRPYEKIYVRAKLRVLNQFIFSNVERQLDHWYNGPGYGAASNWGYDEFISLFDLRSFFGGFLVNDVLKVEVEMEAISSTKYFPNLQQDDGVKANTILGEAHDSHKQDQAIFSRDYNVSSSNALKGLRALPPMSYSLKMESFNTLLQSTNTERYVSRPFPAGGYNWSLVVYPNGNKKDSGSGYLSLYVAIDNSSLLGAYQDVHADLRFYIFNKNERKFFTIQDTHAWRFNVFKTMWGFSQVLPVDTFKNPSNGYLYDGDHCEFGVDVTFPTLFQQSELFSVARNFYNAKYTWTIRGFSTLLKDTYYSDLFSIGGRSWNIRVDPSGLGTGAGKAVSMFLNLDPNEKLRPYERIYVRAKLRVLNQRGLNNVERQIENWFNGPGSGVGSAAWGYNEMISLSDLKDSSKGFLVNDVLRVEVEMEAISSTKYFPS